MGEWAAMDEWCRARSEHLTQRAGEHIEAGKSPYDPDYRVLLGEHRAYMAMRSFIHGAIRLSPSPLEKEHDPNL